MDVCLSIYLSIYVHLCPWIVIANNYCLREREWFRIRSGEMVQITVIVECLQVTPLSYFDSPTRNNSQSTTAKVAVGLGVKVKVKL